MNALSRGVMDIYYRLVGASVALMGSKRSRILKTASALGALRSWIGYVGPKKSRHVFLDHMATALPELSRSEHGDLLRQSWYYHQLRFLDLFVVTKTSKQDLGTILSLSETERVDHALSTGSGALVVTLHIGDPRVCHIALGWKGYPLTLLSARYDDYSPKAREARLRASTKYHRVRFLDRSLRWVFSEIERGSLVFMAVSGYAGSRGHPVTFLNSEIVFSSAPARISRQANAWVIPAVDLFDEHGAHSIRLLDPLPPPETRESLPLWTTRLVSQFEALALAHPAQLDWIWYVIRCQEQRGEVKPYEEGKAIRSSLGEPE